jgi:hypothetical protein
MTIQTTWSQRGGTGAPAHGRLALSATATEFGGDDAADADAEPLVDGTGVPGVPDELEGIGVPCVLGAAQAASPIAATAIRANANGRWGRRARGTSSIVPRNQPIGSNRALKKRRVGGS